MKILILSTAFSGLTQRVVRELTIEGHTLDQHYGLDPLLLRQQVTHFQPDLILCPFLTKRIPEDIWRDYLCLIVHPGIEGDRGPSSLDWAISDGEPEWGVTLLQAAEEMDAGDIWGTANFPLRRAGKTSIYKREVSSTAVKLIKQALRDIRDPDFEPWPLDYNRQDVKGRCRDTMRQNDRAIDWQADSTEDIVRRINAADSSPGLVDTLEGYPVYLFGAKTAAGRSGNPGDIIALHRDGMCRATRDGAVWIRQLKCKEHPQLPPIKLPAHQVCRQLLTPDRFEKLQDELPYSEVNEIHVEREGHTAYIYFDFYNGASSTEQCIALTQTIAEVKRTAEVLVFMGGEDFWNNGIHLNVIEASESPADESWRNINAMNDLVLEILDCPDQVTVAALRNNAGAGGAIMALACDHVVIRDGVVLNPHYQTMGLYGSEYWTYLLPRRVGKALAEKIMDECQPMLAQEAVRMGFADLIFPEDWSAYDRRLRSYCASLTDSAVRAELLLKKAALREQHEAKKPLSAYREEELQHMQRTFYNPDSTYHQARQNFVYKGKPPRMPQTAEATTAGVA